MSMVALRWARGVRGISSTQKLVLWALADSANDYGEAWPSALLLGEDCCLSDRSVREALHALEGRGLIVGQRAKGRSTRWVVRIGSAPEPLAGSSEAGAETSEPPSGVEQGGSPTGNPGTSFRPTPEAPSDPPRNVVPDTPEAPSDPPRNVVPDTPEAPSDITLKNPNRTPNEPPRAAKARGVALAPWMNADAWADWVKYRRSQKGWTEKAAELSMRELGKLRDAGHDPVRVIEQSIANGWRGLFPLKSDQAGRYAPREALHETIADFMRDPMRPVGTPPRPAFDFEGEAEHG